MRRWRIFAVLRCTPYLLAKSKVEEHDKRRCLKERRRRFANGENAMKREPCTRCDPKKGSNDERCNYCKGAGKVDPVPGTRKIRPVFKCTGPKMANRSPRLVP